MKGYDVVIAAVGASPWSPPFLASRPALPACDSYGKEDTLGNEVVVIGGGPGGL